MDLHLDAALAGGLERFARAERATLFMVLFAAFLAVLSRRGGQDDICVGTPVSGRTMEETEDSVGLFSNMLALRGDLTGHPSFRACSRERGRRSSTRSPGRACRSGRSSTSCGCPRDPSRTQVFQAIFSVHTEAGSGVRMPGLRTEPFGVGSPQVIHDLVLDVWRGPTGLTTSLRFDTGLFATDTMAALVRQYESILRAALADPEIRLSELPAC